MATREGGRWRPGPVRSDLGRFRAVWAGLDRSGRFWTGLARLGRSGPLWTGSAGLDRFRTGWAVQVIWAGRNQTGLVPAWTGSGWGADWAAELGLAGRPGLSGRFGPALAGSGRSWTVRVSRANRGGRFPLSRLSGNRPFT